MSVDSVEDRKTIDTANTPELKIMRRLSHMSLFLVAIVKFRMASSANATMA